MMTLSLTSSDTIQCTWHNQGGWVLSPFPYYCHAINYYATQRNEIITKVLTPHNVGKTGADVDGIYYGGGTFHYLPLNIDEFFPSLKAFWVTGTGLKEIKSCHLKSYVNLREFHIENCAIEVIESDLFIHNPKLEYVSLHSNKIKYVENNVIQPLSKSIHIDFNKNLCVDLKSNNDAQFRQLEHILEANCKPTHSFVPKGACFSSNTCSKIDRLQNELNSLRLEHGCATYID